VCALAVTIQVDAGARTSPSAANSARPSHRAAWTGSLQVGGAIAGQSQDLAGGADRHNHLAGFL
jgi:hypothetical protein